MTFIKSNQLCPACKKEHLNINADGSAKCFYATCPQPEGWFVSGTFDVDGVLKTKQIETPVKPMINTNSTRTFNALSERKKSKATAKNYRVTQYNA